LQKSRTEAAVRLRGDGTVLGNPFAWGTTGSTHTLFGNRGLPAQSRLWPVPAGSSQLFEAAKIAALKAVTQGI
jgi:hypothetical protein